MASPRSSVEALVFLGHVDVHNRTIFNKMIA